MSARNYRRLMAERLERRNLLAGDVTVSVSGGDLVITGDADDNYLAVWHDSIADEWVVEGGRRVDGGVPQIGTETTVNGQLTLQTFSGVTGSLIIDLGDGNDQIEISEGTIAGDLVVGLGTGNNVLRLTGGNLPATIGFELNQNTFTRGALSIGGDLSVTSDAGDDLIEIDADVPVEGNVSIVTGDGDDQLVLLGSGTWAVTGNLVLDFGAGDDRFADYTAGLDVGGDVTVTQGATGLNGSVLWLNDAVVSGNVDVTAGAGSNLVQMHNLQAVDVTINLGDDADAVDALNVSVTNFTVDLGNGDDRDSWFEDITASAAVTINGGAGEDIIPLRNITAASVEVNGGDDSDGITAFDIVATNVLFNTGNGNNVIGIYQITATNLTVNGGDGNEGGGFIFGIVVGSSNITGTLTVDSGDGLDNILIGSVTADTLVFVGGPNSDGLIILFSTFGTATIDTGESPDVVGIYDTIFDDLTVLLGDGFDQLWLGTVTATNTATLDGETDGGELYEPDPNTLNGLTISNLTPAVI
jgi:hypothetical protein